MGRVASGKGNLAYLTFMQTLVRWLTKDPALDPVHILLPQNGTPTGVTEVRIKTDQVIKGPHPNGRVSFSVRGPGGLNIATQVKKTEVADEWLGSFRSEARGIYKLKVESEAGSREESLVIGDPDENLDGAPDHERLKRMSALGGGQVFRTSQELLKGLEPYAKMSRSFKEEKRSAAWASPYLFAFILLLLGAEWFIRRRWGLK